MANRFKKHYYFICLAVLIAMLTGCSNASDNTQSSTTVTNTTVQPTVPKTVQLSLEESDYPTVYLDNKIAWESLYYEYLRAIDSEEYKGCALLYINDDDTPELYIKAKSPHRSDMLCYITKNGLSVSSKNISDSEGFWYLEKQYKILVNDVQKNKFKDIENSKAQTEYHNEIQRNADLYYFSGDDLHSAYNLGRCVVDGKSYSNDEDDDGAYDYYDGEKDIPVYDIFEAVKGYFDVEKSKTPDVTSIDNTIKTLKGKRKNPEIKAGEYYGAVSNLVSTYKEASKSIEYYGETKTISYRIPQINLDRKDTKAINQEIIDEFLEDTNHIEAKDDEITRFVNVDYRVYGQNGVLSLVIDGKGFGGTSSSDSRFIYTIDISAGKRISNICLLNSYGIDCQKVSNAFNEQIKADYEAIKNDSNHPLNNSNSGYDESTYDNLYNGTKELFSPVGEYNKMFVDDDGNLNILYMYKWVAGSDFYQKTMMLDIDDLR